VAIGSNRSNFDKSVLKKEERSLLVSHIVNNFFFLESSRFAIRQDGIAKPTTKDRDESGRNGGLRDEIIEFEGQLKSTLRGGLSQAVIRRRHTEMLLCAGHQCKEVKSLSLKPEYANAHNNLARALYHGLCARWRVTGPDVLYDSPTAIRLAFKDDYVAAFGGDFSAGGDGR
jgi:hypothetical protein